MIKLWNKTENIIFPNGQAMTPQELMSDPNFGFSKHAPTVIEQIGTTTMAIDNLHILMQVYKIDEALVDDPEAAFAAVLEARAKQAEEAAAHQDGINLNEAVLIAALKAAFPKQEIDADAVATAMKSALAKE